jgi:hypothetical protein
MYAATGAPAAALPAACISAVVSCLPAGLSTDMATRCTRNALQITRGKAGLWVDEREESWTLSEGHNEQRER